MPRFVTIRISDELLPRLLKPGVELQGTHTLRLVALPDGTYDLYLTKGYGTHDLYLTKGYHGNA